jgi:hypothetical protein
MSAAFAGELLPAKRVSKPEAKRRLSSYLIHGAKKRPGRGVQVRLIIGGFGGVSARE